MRTIFKYPLQSPASGGLTLLDLPRKATAFRFARQGEAYCLWVILNTDEMNMVRRTFRIVGTGHPLKENEGYIGTVDDPPFVWHLVEELS